MSADAGPARPAQASPSGRLVLLASTHRVAPGLLSWPAWEVLHAADAVVVPSIAHPLVAPLEAAGIALTLAEPAEGPHALAATLVDAAAAATVVWVASDDGDVQLVRAIGDVALERPDPPDIELVTGSYDLPGARLLDVVEVMDRLRGPGGCPWDAEQTHASLAPYLIEEAYEALEQIEAGDLDALREEMGDVLLQVVFHARLAEELPDEERWTVDDVAAALVDKLVRRHPHVFGTATARDAGAVEASWKAIKDAEKGRTSVTEGVPLGQPALALVAALVHRAAQIGVPPDLSLADPDGTGERLFALAAAARAEGEDPEAALRAVARAFRDRLADVEAGLRAGGVDPATLDPTAWRAAWLADR